jgi:hypothetical protein
VYINVSVNPMFAQHEKFFFTQGHAMISAIANADIRQCMMLQYRKENINNHHEIK